MKIVDQNKEYGNELKALENLHTQTLEYFHKNGGGVYPYENYNFLKFISALHKPKNILEVGTGLGLTSIAMALGCPETQITTVDKNLNHINLAKQNARQFEVENQIIFKNSLFLEVTETTPNQTFDLVFFDGFTPGFIIFLELERVLKSGGLMVMANLTLRGDVKKITQKVGDEKYYQHFFRFQDTIFAIKN
jgi:predicted O-methyltransferase YrrM